MCSSVHNQTEGLALHATGRASAVAHTITHVDTFRRTCDPSASLSPTHPPGSFRSYRTHMESSM